MSAGAQGVAVTSLDLPDECSRALEAADTVLARAQSHVARRVAPGGKIDAAALDRDQHAAHGFAWLATYVAALRATLDWAGKFDAAGQLGERERLILQLGFGEYLAQIIGGIPMSQGEIVRPSDLGLGAGDLQKLSDIASTFQHADLPALRARLAELIAEGEFGEAGLDDEALLMVRDQFRRFAEDHREDAHRWHLKDELIPLEIIGQLAEMGVFGLTVPEEFGGSGLGKLAMCVVTEELSRGYIGLGSLGTRSEIAAELIRLGGTEEQKQYWLPKLASGEILPTAVFTEPNTGSDLGSRES